MTLGLLALFVGGILLYAGIKGRSVSRMLIGDNQAAKANEALPK